MKGSIVAIVNGQAGSVAAAPDRDAFLEVVHQQLPAAKVVFTKAGDDVGKLVRSAVAEGASVVIAGGGDGTVNAVASALVDTDVVLGVLPLGTLNHFAKDIHIPLDLAAALRTIADNAVEAVDVGDVNGRVFINNSGLGLYPDMVFNREERQRKGASKWPAAFSESVRAFARYRLVTIRVKVDGQQLNRRTPAVFVGNNEYSMEGTIAGKRTSLTRGELALYIPHPTTRLRLVLFSLRALFGNPAADAEFDKILTSDFTIASHRKRWHVSIDGEVTTLESPLKYRIRPKSLNVIVGPEVAA